jgi:hypothetical protein
VAGLEDSFLQPADGAATFAQLATMLKKPVRQMLEGDDAPEPKDIAEVMAYLLAYCVSIERILAKAAGRSGHLPGHSVSVRGYVEQAMSGEARSAAVLRLSNYFKDAITWFMKTHAGQQETIDRFAQDLADAIRPGQIENRVQANGLLKMFGLHEGVYWREFRKQFRSLDASGVKQLVEEQRHKEGRGG